MIDSQLRFLPGPLRYFGVSANATLISFDAPTIQMADGVTYRHLPQLIESSRYIVNAQIFYTWGPFFAEIAYNHTGKQPISFDRTNAVNDQWYRGTDIVDGQMSYRLRPGVALRVQGQEYFRHRQSEGGRAEPVAELLKPRQTAARTTPASPSPFDPHLEPAMRRPRPAAPSAALALAVAGAAAAAPLTPPPKLSPPHDIHAPPLPVAELQAQELRRWPAPEARQGVAVDARFFYAVVNTRIAKYDRVTGAKVAEWVGDRRGITHLNSCVVDGGELVCANSDFPELPMASSVEVFDTATLKHLRSRPLGVRTGSLTWVQRHGGYWWAGFANYDLWGGDPGHDHRWTMVVKFDAEWRQVGGYRFPESVLERFAPTSNSGGGWGDDGLLYVTGHDRKEIYALREPGEGPTLEHVATIDAPLDGQAWSWDPSQPRTLFGITRTAQVVSMRIPVIPASAGR